MPFLYLILFFWFDVAVDECDKICPSKVWRIIFLSATENSQESLRLWIYHTFWCLLKFHCLPKFEKFNVMLMKRPEANSCRNEIDVNLGTYCNKLLYVGGNLLSQMRILTCSCRIWCSETSILDCSPQAFTSYKHMYRICIFAFVCDDSRLIVMCWCSDVIMCVFVRYSKLVFLNTKFGSQVLDIAAFKNKIQNVRILLCQF